MKKNSIKVIAIALGLLAICSTTPHRAEASNLIGFHVLLWCGGNGKSWKYSEDVTYPWQCQSTETSFEKACTGSRGSVQYYECSWIGIGS
jgi:hypothetical protein